MSAADYHQVFSNWNMCVLIPTYNHCDTLAGIIDGMMVYTDQIIVVNDGSTDKTASVLDPYRQIITVIDLPKNRGKGQALRTGFKHAIETGYDRCMTIDSDGQHFPADVPSFLNALELHSEGIIMGTRTLNHDDVPGASTFGNKFANFWFWVITGRKLKDTQSGFRIYPLMRMKKLTFYSQRYEYEMEILIRLAWRDVDISPVPIEVYYAPGELRISHFKKVKDFTRITLLNIYLLIISILYWHPVMLIRKIKKKSLKELVREHLLSSGHSNLRISSALMVGIFFGVAPIWGFQMLSIVGVCILFKLNKPLALLIAQISLPPFIPFVIYVSYVIGGWFVKYFTSMKVHVLDFNNDIGLADLSSGFFQYVVGAVVFGAILAALTGVISMIVLGLFRNEIDAGV
jgi:glycosyltransferase involved in cell wall biosynthesis